MTTTIRLFDGDLGSASMLVRCNLSEASAPVEVDYCEGDGWQPTQYQCANARHTTDGLAVIGQSLAAQAVEMSDDDFSCEWESLDADGALDNLFDRAHWRSVDEIGSYVACCYGRDGDEPGTVNVVLERATVDGITAYRWSEDDGGGASEIGEITLDRDACVADGLSHCEAADETPDDDEQIADVLAAGWFASHVDASDVREIIDYCDSHSHLGQGHVIIDRDGRREWVTTGYVEHEAIYLSVPHGGQPWSAYAADLLRGVSEDAMDEAS